MIRGPLSQIDEVFLKTIAQTDAGLLNDFQNSDEVMKHSGEIEKIHNDYQKINTLILSLYLIF